MKPKKIVFSLRFGYILENLLVDQSFANENRIYPNNETSEICMNDVIMKEKSEKNWNAQTRNLNVETKGSINEKKESEEIVIWKLTLKSYML